MSQHIHRPDTKDLSFCVLDLKSIIKKQLLGKNRKYEKVIRDLIEYDSNKEDGVQDSVKSICEALGISNAKYRKALELVYADLLDLLADEDNIALQYPTYTCHLTIQGFRDTYANVSMQLQQIPRVGEGMYLPFLKAQLDTNYFHVDTIEHRFSGDAHEIILFLKTGPFNSYEKLKEEELKMTNHPEWLKKQRF